jgi:hypothetical protein
MDIIGSLFVFVGLAIISYIYSKKKKMDLEDKLEMPNHQRVMDATKEIQRRNKIASRVDNFLNESKFIEQVATWRNEKIYKYIFNDGFLYEFDEIMPENNQRIGMDDEYLCFKQLSYKRVNNPEEFIQKFANQIAEKINKENLEINNKEFLVNQ